MTIVFFCRLFYPHIGGVEKHVWEISQILIKEKHKIIVVCEKHQEGLLNDEIYDQIEIYRIPLRTQGFFKKFEIWWWLWQKRELIQKADLVHCHDVFYWFLPFRFLYPQKPVYTTFHGYETFPVSKKAIIVRKISEKLSRGTICVGDFMKKWYRVNPNFVLYGGVDVFPRRKPKPKKNSAVFIGRLDEQTGILTYVEAVKLIRKKIPDFEFIVVGDGKYRKEVGKHTRVLGFKKEPENYFDRYHFAFVSRYLSILEAMAAKRLVFAIYDNPIKRDYLQMVPFARHIFITNSVEEIAERVLFFLKNPKDEQKKVKNAFDWVKSQSWENVLGLYMKLWKIV